MLGSFMRFIALLLVIGLLVQVQISQGQTTHLDGRVIDQSSQEPIPGATISLHETNQHVITDSMGYFTIAGLRAGSYHLHVSYIGYQAIDLDIKVRPGMDPVRLEMKRSFIELGQVNIEEDLVKSTLKDRPLNIEVVDQQYMEKNLDGNLANTLSKMPGFSSINTGTGIGKPVIRGLSFNRVVVNNNGIKQEGQQWGSDHGLEIDQYGIGKIELVKGPASLLYGSDGIGGVVNILPPNIPPENSLRAEVQGNLASVNDLRGGSAMVEGNHQDVFIRGRFSYQRFNDFHVPADNFTYNTYVLPIENERLKNTAGEEYTASVSTGIRRDWGNLQLHYSDFNQKAGLFTGAIGIPRGYQLEDDGNPSDINIPRQVNRHQNLTLNGKILMKEDWLHFDIGYQRNNRREESFPHLHGQGPAPEDNLALLLDLETYAANFRYHHFFTEDFKSIFGLSGQYKQNEYDGFEFLVPAYRYTSAGAYYFMEYHFSEVSTLSGGLRYDYGLINSDRHLQPVYNADTITRYDERVPALTKQFNNLSGSVGWSWLPNEYWNLKINVGKTFRMPNPAEFGSNGVHHGTFRHEKGDTSLTSEHGYQLDLGIYYQRKQIHLKVSPYFNYFRDFIFLRPSGEFSLLPDAGQIYQYQQADALHTGFETTIDYHPMEKLHLEAGAAYVWNYNLETFLPLPFTPPFNIDLSVDYDLGSWGQWLKNANIAASTSYHAPQNRTDRNEPATPGYMLLNAQAAFHFTIAQKQSIRLHVGVKNLLDTQYLKHLSRYRILNLPEPGRSFTLSVKVPLHLIE